jgi:hypothetical protein
MEELQDRLDRHGFSVPTPTLYAYERGKDAGGVDLPLELIPIVAAAYGYRTAHGWLPDE